MVPKGKALQKELRPNADLRATKFFVLRFQGFDDFADVLGRSRGSQQSVGVHYHQAADRRRICRAPEENCLRVERVAGAAKIFFSGVFGE